MASRSELVDTVVKEALEQVEKYAPAEYKSLAADPAKKEQIVQAARTMASETLKLTEELRDQPQNIAERLSKHLSEDRIKLLHGGLDIPTFRMEISKKDDGKHWLALTREGTEFLPSRAMISAADIDWGSVQQYASILVEAVLLVISAAGISISPSGNTIRKTVDEAAEAIRSSSKLQRALDDFVKAWNAAGSNSFGKAEALFKLIKEIYAAGILWTTIKSLCSNMSTMDWIITSAKVTAMIIAALATYGIALIAEIALIVAKAVDFALKITNIIQLSELKKTI